MFDVLALHLINSLLHGAMRLALMLSYTCKIKHEACIMYIGDYFLLN